MTSKINIEKLGKKNVVRFLPYKYMRVRGSRANYDARFDLAKGSLQVDMTE